jgi:serine/threonine protein kinase
MQQPEAKALRALSHPNIVQCKEFILDRKSNAHLVFELMTDGNLEALCRTRRYPLDDKEFVCIARQMLHAVAYMHSHHYLHRDIKPENVLLSYHPSAFPEGDLVDQNFPQPIVKLADLGLAKFIKRAQSRPITSYVATRVSVRQLHLGFEVHPHQDTLTTRSR